MIYTKSYFKKELKLAYIENKVSSKRKLAFSLFLGLVSFALHFVLQTLTQSVLMDTVPHIMQTSYFSTLYVYNVVMFILYIVYFIIYYDYLSFEEIRKNRWYLLVKMGYHPLPMIFSKLLASLGTIVLVYTGGFAFTLILTVFLKYNFIIGYFPSLYIVGLIDILLISMLSHTASLYVKNPTNARYFIFFSSIGVLVLKGLLGYNTVITNRIMMQDFRVLFDFGNTLYIPVAASLCIICGLVCFLRARGVAKYYSVPYDTFGYVMPEKQVLKFDKLTGRITPLKSDDSSAARGKAINALTTTFLILFICAALAFNVFVILISTSQPGKEVTIRGVIPYVFKSNTMEPAIMENDLAYFKKIDSQAPIKTGDIVLFTEKNVVYVERVISYQDGLYQVDIDYYPPLAQEGVMKKTVDREAIYGVFSHRNRWLGALILFANTIFGRLVFLLIPAFLLFFYEPMQKYFAKRAQKYKEDQE